MEYSERSRKRGLGRKRGIWGLGGRDRHGPLPLLAPDRAESERKVLTVVHPRAAAKAPGDWRTGVWLKLRVNE